MNWWYFTYGLIVGVFLFVELVGVFRKGKRDTFTEGWRTIDRRGGWVRWALRFTTAGLLLWAAFHFLGDGRT